MRLPGAASGSLVPAHARNFGKYTLIVKLATGGMAEIYLARLKGVAGFEKFVVIKRILPHLAEEPQFVNMFLDEARIAARISHANVCQVYELGEVDGQYFLAMEYLDGVTLNTAMRKLSRERRLADPRLVAGIIAQACEGLHHAHDLRDQNGAPLSLVHRDVSPQNLFVTVDGLCKLLDFGIAKAQGASTKTRTGTVKGKYAYMPPEQLKGDPLDRRVDVWALGVVLFEALTGKRLFWRDTDFLIFRAITEEPIPHVRDYRPDVPAALDAAVHKALSRQRDERYPSARALGDAITGALAALGGPLPQMAVGAELRALFREELEAQQALIAQALGSSEQTDVDTQPQLGGGGSSGGISTPAITEQPTRQLPSDPAAARVRPRAPTPVPLPGNGAQTSKLPSQPSMQAPGKVPSQPSLQARQSRSSILPLPPPSEDSGSTEAIPENLPSGVATPQAPPGVASPMATTARTPFLSDADDTGAVTSNGAALAFNDSLKPSGRKRGAWLVAGLAVVAGVLLVLLLNKGSGKNDGELQSTAAVPAPSPRPPSDPVVTPPPPKEKLPTPPPPKEKPRPVAAPPPDAGVVAIAPPDPPVDPKEKVAPPKEKVVPRDPPPREKIIPPREKDPPPREPKEKDPPREKTPPPVDAEPGFIAIDSDPYAVIYVDGKKIGMTPLPRITLAPGTHKVRAVSSAGEKTFSITIEAGKEAKGKKLTW